MFHTDNRSYMQSTMVRVGSAFLILGSLAKYFLYRLTSIGDGIGDGLIGMCYGIAFACMLLGIRKEQPKTQA